MLSRVIKAIKLRLVERHSWEYYKTILVADFPAEVKTEGNTLCLQKLNLRLLAGEGMPVLENYALAVQLATNLGAAYRLKINCIEVTFDRFQFEIQTAEDLFILNEVYVEGSYNFLVSGQVSPLVVIDIGMNVGFASVFFAANEKISKVYSYEPFTPTYQQAIRHLQMNMVNEKVQAANYGLGGAARQLEVDYTPEFKGQVGIHGTGLVKSEVSGAVKEVINIEEVGKELNRVAAANAGADYIFKIDCEGAEYEIMEKIPATIIAQTKLFMIEWHEKGPADLLLKLEKNGFTSFSFNASSKKVGMLYAVKQG